MCTVLKNDHPKKKNIYSYKNKFNNNVLNIDNRTLNLVLGNFSVKIEEIKTPSVKKDPTAF